MLYDKNITAKMAMIKTLSMFFAANYLAIFMYLNLAMAANYTVGGPNGGWDQSTDLATWASSITFLEGDNLLFEFTTNHDVTEVSRTDFDSCNPNSPLRPPFTGGSATVALSSAGSRYFICGTPGHCLGGMKLQVDTHAATSPPPQTATPSAPSPAPVSSPPPRSHAPSPSPKHTHGPAGRPASPPAASPRRPALPPAASPPPSGGSLLAPAAAPSAAGRFSAMGALTACCGFLAVIVFLTF
ncbi:early nodulin 20 [Striga asiatica]|uniref:Early nodulin 20 n=1 Tax=Striga asiatica TaxID=4170 RepID=A0A5A7R6W5_STRAF|nr:early nodulin 20 [Striga asiatica]